MGSQVIVVHQSRPSSCRKVCCLVTSMLTFTVAIAILIFGSVAVVGPYSHESKYETTECNSTSVTWGNKYSKCNCHTEYDDKELCTEGTFPCLNIQVVYKDKYGVQHSSKLYQSYSSMDSDSQCSYPACNAYNRNEIDIPGAPIFIQKNQAVQDYASQHAQGKVYPCYYILSKFDNVVGEKNYTTLDAFHVIFWPLLVMIITIVLTVVVLRMCKKQDQGSGVEFNRFY
ncbi:uncharacterized protein LOC117108361 [Anneissia japonica]|uniref:uncharacterized protein LOC117108361 n=1 Tax=Anneissia japonica TaxID=1529436 RepID=UPI00142553A8|nr:uncharacterized protein LOC117108361 [Anneissia japonica]XP_033106250.1 uncharacterized protein LOC117108361 [Anneissia japonica]